MSSLNKVMLIGNLGSDPELRTTPSGTSVCNFSLATSESYKDKQGERQEKTDWHKIIVWGAQADSCGQYLAKGRQVYIEGKIGYRTYEDEDGNKRYVTEITANQVQFWGRVMGMVLRVVPRSKLK